MEVPGKRDFARFEHWPEIPVPTHGDCALDEQVTIRSEMIQGRWYSRGEREICIGTSKEVQDLLGIQFEVFEAMEKRINELQAEVNTLKLHYERRLKKYTEFKCMSRWSRLIFLFRGVRYDYGE